MEQRPPLRVIRAFPVSGGGALVHLHNLSGGILGGDKLDMDVVAGPRTHVQLTTTGATRIYRARPATPLAEQCSKIAVGEGALLEYLPDSLIPFAGARYRQQTEIALADGAGLIWWETLAPGREAAGELFAYDILENSLQIIADGLPIATDAYCLKPGVRSVAGFGQMGKYRYLSTLYICRVGVTSTIWLTLERQLNALANELSRPGEILWGASALVASGVVVRGLSRSGTELPTALHAFWHLARRALYGSGGCVPRKVY